MQMSKGIKGASTKDDKAHRKVLHADHVRDCNRLRHIRQNESLLAGRVIEDINAHQDSEHNMKCLSIEGIFSSR